MEAESFKNKLRKNAILKRKEIQNKKYLDERIKIKLLKNQYVKNSKNILVYLSKKYEVDTFSFIEELLKLNKNVYTPRVVGNEIKFYKLENLSSIRIGKFDIYESTSNIEYNYNNSSCIIVPGLLFDKNNNRLGYGGGYYDRFLSNIDIYKIGVCYKCFLVDYIKCKNHDIKMDIVLTER